MNKSIKYWILLLVVLLSLEGTAQLPSNRIKPAVMYHSGDTIRSMRLGVTTRIPEGWSGNLPRDTEVFLLMPEIMASGEIYVVVNEKTDLQQQTRRWEQGMSLDETIKLKPDGEIKRRGENILTVNGKLVGDKVNDPRKIYAESICSPAGFCMVFFAIGDPGSFDLVKKALQSFVDNTTFGPPSNESPYLNFNWQKFLSGKILLSMTYDDSGKKTDEVDLCSDGTFHSKIKRTGIFKDLAKGYQGAKSGTWSVESKGEKATITFKFQKLESVSIDLEARDEEIYIRNDRYFVGESQRCK
jgi:hypothetical protein